MLKKRGLIDFMFFNDDVRFHATKLIDISEIYDGILVLKTIICDI